MLGSLNGAEMGLGLGQFVLLLLVLLGSAQLPGTQDHCL